MTRPWLGYNSKAACEGGWEFYSREDDKVLPLDVVNAYIVSVNGQDSLIPAEYLRQHPELLKAATEGGQIITKAESGVGGKLPPLAPEARPFDPVSANPYRRSAPPPSADQPPAPKFDPVASSPYRYQPPKPKPEPERRWWPRHS